MKDRTWLSDENTSQQWGHHMGIIGGLISLLTFPLLAAGLILLWQGWRGMPEFSEPHCRKCGYDLRGLDGNSAGRACPECGSDVTRAGAILFGRNRRRPRRMAAGAALLRLGILVPVGATTVISMLANPRKSYRSNAAVIRSLATTANQPWDWQELESRHSIGKLSQADVVAAIDQLIAYLKTTPSQQGQPLHWADRFFKLAITSGDVSTEQLGRLCDAFYGSVPQVQMRHRIRTGVKLTFDVEYPLHWDLPGAMSVLALRTVELDGEPVEATPEYASIMSRQYLSGKRFDPIRAQIQTDFAPGKHEVHFEFDVGLLDEKAKLDPRYSGRPGQAERWPNPLVKWTRMVKMPLEVVPPNASAVTLVTDPARDPSNAVGVASIQVMPQGQRVRFEPQLKIGQLPVPVLFRFRAEVQGRRFDMGWWGQSGRRSASMLGGTAASLPADLKEVTLILEPDAKTAEEQGQFDEIWGKPITLEHVPLERYDLEKDEAPAP